MIVCHCHGISDREIKAACRSGEPILAGSSCGGCKPMVDAIVEAHGGHAAPSGRLSRLSIVTGSLSAMFSTAVAAASD